MLAAFEANAETPFIPKARGGNATAFFAHYYGWHYNSCQPVKVTDGHTKASFTFKPRKNMYGPYDWYANQFPQADFDVPRVIERQVQVASAYGLAGFAYEWNGPYGEDSGENLGNAIFRNVFVPAVDRSVASSKVNFKYYLTLDTIMWSDNNNRVRADGNYALDATMKDWIVGSLKYACTNYTKNANYFKLDGRPVFFLYGYHRWAGLVGETIAAVRSECQKANGVNPYLIGDFNVGGDWGFSDIRGGSKGLYEVLYYRLKSQHVDAVANYGQSEDPINPEFRGADSVKRYLDDSRIRRQVDNGLSLGASSQGRQYFPGITPQYMKVLRTGCGEDARRKIIFHPSALDEFGVTQKDGWGYNPLLRWNDPQVEDLKAQLGGPAAVERVSRSTIKRIFDAINRVSRPRVAMITSWNESVEGTTVEPSLEKNEAGFALDDKFLHEMQARMATQSGDANGYLRQNLARYAMREAFGHDWFNPDQSLSNARARNQTVNQLIDAHLDWFRGLPATPALREHVRTRFVRPALLEILGSPHDIEQHTNRVMTERNSYRNFYERTLRWWRTTERTDALAGYVRSKMVDPAKKATGSSCEPAGLTVMVLRTRPTYAELVDRLRRPGCVFP